MNVQGTEIRTGLFVIERELTRIVWNVVERPLATLKLRVVRGDVQYFWNVGDKHQIYSAEAKKEQLLCPWDLISHSKGRT
jgi:hypothetical protein